MTRARSPVRPLAPGATIGILGGGQLGRMTALAAAALGYKCHVFTEEPEGPASQVAAQTTARGYPDLETLVKFSETVDVVTFEFENIPLDAVNVLADLVPVRPRPECLRVAQDRILEKNFINGLGIATAPYAEVRGPQELAAAAARIGRPAVLKTARMGYDGKGQVLVDADCRLEDAWSRMVDSHVDWPDEPTAILESFVPLEKEISVIVARGGGGAWAAYPPVENRHVNHILDTTRAPADVPQAVAAEAVDIARRLAEALDLVGLLAVEMFVAPGDGGLRLLVNEIAPRPHNSGHWTIDACRTSQFEQFVRAIVGLPLGPVERHADAIMKNLIGDEAKEWLAYAAEPDAKLHLYGKAESRPGRKMGHVTRLYPKGGLPPAGR